MSLAVQLFSNVKLLIQNETLPENILLYVQFKTNSYFGRCFTKTDSPIDIKEFIKLMTHLDEELLKLEDVWKESYGDIDEIHKLATSFKKWNELVVQNLAIICELMLNPDGYVAYILNHMSIVHEAESERILSIETEQPKIHDEAKMKLRKECLQMVMVYPCLKRLEALKRLNEDLKMALDQAEGCVNPYTVHQFIKIIVGMNGSSSEEIEEFVKCRADADTTDDVSKELETLEYARLLEQLNSKKKYYGIRDEKTTDSVNDILPLMAMMGHMVDVKKSDAKYKEPTASAGSMTGAIFAMMEGALKHEKPGATHRIMKNMFEIHQIMRDAFIEPDDEN